MFNEKKVNFKDFSRPNEEIRYFSRTFTEFRTFQDIYLLKIQDLFKIVQTMQLTESLKQVN